MKFTLSWLKEHLETNESLENICDKLTAIGLEIEDVADHAKALDSFTVAQVVEAEQHPDADRLKLCKVDTGKETLQIVCGAPNARKGIKVVLARIGDVIPSTGAKLKPSKIRGQASEGMMCSGAELNISDDHDGIIELPETAEVGAKFIDVMPVADPVIEIGLTPNRADCTGVHGIARDLAAAGMGTLIPMKIDAPKGTEPCGIHVTLDFPDELKKNCPVFVGCTIRNIKNCHSPDWLQQRLRAIGLRPISALVDITNYITFNCSRPLHVFDMKSIKGDLWVRPAKGGETFDALDDKSYTLQEGMTAIGDDTGFLSMAGIIGGVTSGCEEDTTDVFIESAYFDSSRTAQTGQALGVVSDARYRFERGVDPQFTVAGCDLAVQMILEICGTEDTIVSERLVVGDVPKNEQKVPYNPSMMAKLIGVDVADDEQEKILTALGFGVGKSGDDWTVTVPSWRHDVEGSADMTEEVIRIKGYDCIPTTSMPRVEAITKGSLDLLERRSNAAKRSFASRGLMEAVTWSFMSSEIAVKFAPVNDALRLVNPISSDLDMMRSTLVANLIMAAKRNADKGYADVALCEVGSTYHDQTPEGQVLMATALRAGQTPRHWADKARSVDVFDAKADAIAALVAAGGPESVQIREDAPSWYHPGRSGSLCLGKNVLGYFGEIHPAILEACDASGPMVACELFLANIPASRKNGTEKKLLLMEPLQPVHRDFAFVMDENIDGTKLISAIIKAEKKLITDVTIFDVYQGKGVPDGQKSVALSVALQPKGKALTEAELEGFAAKVTQAAQKVGATLRG